jgi:hypothetical protein
MIHPTKRTLTFNNETVFLDENEEDNQPNDVFIAEIDEDNLNDDMDWTVKNNETQLGTDLNIEQRKQFFDLIEKYKKCFARKYEDLGRCKTAEFEIETDNAKPIYILPYRKSQVERVMIREEVEKMLRAGIIRPSKSPWSSPVVMVPKKDGSKRFCVDYRKLNKVTQQDCFPLPRIDDTLDRLSGSKYLTVIDLKSGYWQIKLTKDAIPKTAFSTPDGHFEFLVCAFGLKNGPS